MDYSTRACIRQANRAFFALAESKRLASLGEKITLPASNKHYSVEILMKRGSRSLSLRLMFSPDSTGNRHDRGEIEYRKLPSGMELHLRCVGEFSDEDRDEFFSYREEQPKIFTWSPAPAEEDGFSEVIRELIRLRAVLDGLDELDVQMSKA